MNNKTIFLHDHIVTHSYDIFAICETWFRSDNGDTYINALLPPGYDIHHIDRPNSERGGGVALVYKQHLSIKLSEHAPCEQFEQLKCTLIINKHFFDIFVIYRPPPTVTNNLSVAQFMDEWSTFLSHHAVTKSNIILLGDLNFHLDNQSSTHTRNFQLLLDSYGLTQHISSPTHYCGHTLDVLITRDTDTLVCDAIVSDIALCNDDGKLVKDHYAIMFSLPIHEPVTNTKVITFRNKSRINIASFRSDIASSTTLNNTTGTIDELTDRYITGLSSLYDAHAPLITRTITIRTYSPWYTPELRDAKRKCRKLERTWRRNTSDESTHVEYRQQCARRTKQLEETKTVFYSTKVKESRGNQKELFKIANGLLSQPHQKRLPTSYNDTNLATLFNVYFDEKIIKIRSNFTTNICNTTTPAYTQTKLTTLHPTTADEVRRLIGSCSPKCCELDPIPTWLLKECIEEVLPLITSIFNESLTLGTYPDTFKEAIIKPLLKHGKTDTEDFKSYRPISNLHFVSKVLEKIVVQRLETHMDTHSLYDPMQSAYKSGYSTETSTLKLNNDILTHMDEGRCTLLVALDLSAAFDTIDHTIFLDRLRDAYCVEDTALQWFRSYLNNRTQRVCINSTTSSPLKINSGVPQGSVLGARLFTMYTRPLSDIILKHGVLYNSYADDTQLYIHCNNDAISIHESICRLEHCIADIIHWMSSNSLKLNEEKTEFIVFNNKQDFSDTMILNVGNNKIKASNTIKILGVTFDQRLSLEKQITNTCRTTYIQTRKINSIRKYLTQNATQTLIQALVTVRLDYCNSLYVGLPLSALKRLQNIQNTTARVITRISRYSHITETLNNLHWLPIRKRCQYKVLVTVYKSLHKQTPPYINDLLHWYQPNRPLRSSCTTSLVPRRSRSIRLSKRLLNTSGAVFWNNLPHDIKAALNIVTFKKLIKTYLFTL